MNKKDKFLITLLTICTFGLCWLHWNRKNKKLALQKTQKEKIKLPSSVKIDELIHLLGTKDNIKEISHTISNLKISFKNKSKIDINKISKLKYVTGIMSNSDKITLVVGDIAEKISTEINNKIK
ncbi:PTS transporter subunit EIIB [Mycoplasmopsis lipofaciens]|uniref:PTS transporter subunit EIIB n=1 Tax=Mycoplasmopsis lipofaciens TaxID=114884 RepID=UPI000486ABA8|nr:PTS transporter subunit EIIB [Mycoplasmopsis lipofaciens]